MSGPTLTAPFKNTQELSKGGRSFTYIPAAEVVERLNACLGYGNWNFRVVSAFHQPADDPQYVVAHGHLEALGAVFEQFGGQTPNRNKQGVILDLADDYKGAASDAMKKCAAMIGVGLYLSLKRGPTPHELDSSGTAPSAADASAGVAHALADTSSPTGIRNEGRVTGRGNSSGEGEHPPAPLPGVTPHNAEEVKRGGPPAPNSSDASGDAGGQPPADPRSQLAEKMSSLDSVQAKAFAAFRKSVSIAPVDSLSVTQINELLTFEGFK